MLIMIKGKGCVGCPFHYLEYEHEYGELASTRPMCALDGQVDSSTGETLDIKIDVCDDYTAMRPASCPWKDPHGVPVEVYNEE
jgi:hypothetical protein